MAIVRRDAVQSLVGLQSCGGSRFYCCIIAELYKQGAHQDVTFTRVQICLNGIGRRFRLLPEICILNLCTTSSFSLATAAAAASNEMKRHRDVSEVNGMVGNAKSEALQSVNPGGCSQHRTADRVSHLSSINVPEHKQMLMQIESNSPPNKRHMVTSASSSIHRGQHMLNVFTALDAEYKAFELPLTTKTSVDCSSLTKRVDSWMCSIEETQHKARVMSEESADLKQRLESLLSEIVSTQTQLVDGVSPHARPNHLGTPCGEPTMCLERKVVDIKDGRCKNNNFFEITSSSNASEDESLRERHCPSLTSRHAGITSSMDVHTVTEEQMSDLSDADLMFEEDIEAVMQSILTDSSIKTAPDFATSLPFDLSYATESQHQHQLGDHDDSCLDSRGGIIPDAMRSAFELNSSSHHCDLVDSSYICDAERTALAEKEAIMSASHVHGRADCAEKRTAWNEDSGIETPDTPLFSECCTSQSRDVECLKPVRQSKQKKNAMAGYCGFFRADSASEEDCFQPREGVLNAETELDSSPATKVKGTTESTNDEAPALA